MGEQGNGSPASARTLRVHRVERFPLDCGTVLHDVRQAYYLDGALNDARDNLVLVLHALTGSADAAGDWWRGLIGPGLVLDTDRFAVLAPNLLGSCYGTTGPSTCGGTFPPITTRDMARLAGHLVEELGVSSVALVTGGSLGGMVALEWALLHPGRARSTVVFAAPAAHTALAIGWNHVQREALRLGRDGTGRDGVALARMIAMLSFRTEREFEERFGRTRRDEATFNVQSYLAHHGEKLVARFDAATYRTLLDAMDAHDVGRDRGGLAAALATLTGRVTAVGIPGDLLYSADVVRAWAELAGAAYRELQSVHGHDAFLLECEQVGRILREALAEETGVRCGAPAGGVGAASSPVSAG